MLNVEYINQDLKDKALEVAKVEEIAEDFLPLKVSGASFLQTCHCCGGKNKMNITPSKQIFKCFSCGEGGKYALNYLIKIQGKSPEDAFRYLVDRYNLESVITESKQSGKRPKGVSFRDMQLRNSGIPFSFQQYKLKIPNGEGSKVIEDLDRYEKGSVDRHFMRIEGDDMIIHYLDFNYNAITFRREGSKTEIPFFRVRYAIPENHASASGKIAKYRSPHGSGNHIYLPNYIIEAVRTSKNIETLFICEGEKKADKLCVHNIPAVGIAGIHNFNPRGEMPHHFGRIIRDCNVKRVVFLVDSDWDNLSVKPGQSVDQRPRTFSRAIIKFKQYFKHFAKEELYLDMYFGYHLDKVQKGIDDLLVYQLQNREDKLLDDFKSAFIDREGKGELVKLHNITTDSDYQIRSIWQLHSNPAFIKHHKDELAKLKEFRLGRIHFYVNEDGQIDLAQKIQPSEKFWHITRKKDKFGNETGEIDTKFKYKPSRLFLRNRGFGKIRVNGGQVCFVHVEDNIVRKVDSQEIRDYVLQFVENIEEDDVLEMLLSGSFRYFGDAALNNMYDREVEFLKPEKGVKYLAFENCAWKITHEGISEIKLTDLPGHLWDTQVIRFSPTLQKDPLFTINRSEDKWSVTTNKAFDHSDIAQFIYKTSVFFWRKQFDVVNDKLGGKILIKKKKNMEITEEDLDHTYRHMISKMLSIGYVMQDYKDLSQMKAIIAMDGAESEVGASEGGTGKSIFGTMFENILPTEVLDGKDKNLTNDKFLYDGVEDWIKVIVFDDCRVNLDFEHFLSQITRGLTVNWKGKTKFKMVPPPVLLFLTNHAVNGRDNSTLRRQYTIAFSDYFGAWKTPKDEFGHQLFQEWDKVQWNLFYNYIALCGKEYMKHGLAKVINEKSIKRRKLRQEIGESIIDWASTKFNSESHLLNNKWEKKWGYRDFKDEYPQEARHTDVRRFKQKLQTYCTWAGLDFNPGYDGKPIKSSSKEYIIIGDENFDLAKCIDVTI